MEIRQGWYSIRADDEDAIPEEIIQELSDKLPHGSGIDYDWHLTVDWDRWNILAHNAFHAMNETGMYCHAWSFTVTIPVFMRESEEQLDIVSIDWSDEELGEVNFDNCDPEEDCPTEQDMADYLSQFEPDEYGEYPDEAFDGAPSGCGFGLQDYLEDTIHYALTGR